MKKFQSSLKKWTVLLLLGTAAGWWGRALVAAPLAPGDDSAQREAARRGLDVLMDGDPDAAIEIFRQIQRNDPDSPLGYLFEADALWWKIYYATGDLIDPDVFDVVSAQKTPYDAHFEDLVNISIKKSEARIRARQDEARNYLYQGLAYALRGRLTGLRGRDLPSARAGKKMRSHLLTALRLDPNLTDAYLGVGIYNYFVDTLPTIVKVLRFFIALPGGSRELGLQQLRQVAENGELSRPEAKFYLAKNFSRRNEQQFSRSLELFEELCREYPNNPLWPMMVASLHCRLGQSEQCDAMYREIFRKTTGEKSQAEQAVHSATQIALQRLHPNEKFAPGGD